MKVATVGDLFRKKTQQWGLRGDPHLWSDMARVFRPVPLPESEQLLVQMIESAYLALTAQSIHSDVGVFVERYARGGMSSGCPSPEFWREKAIPLLIQRYRSLQESSGEQA